MLHARVCAATAIVKRSWEVCKRHENICINGERLKRGCVCPWRCLLSLVIKRCLYTIVTECGSRRTKCSILGMIGGGDFCHSMCRSTQCMHYGEWIGEAEIVACMIVWVAACEITAHCLGSWVVRYWVRKKARILQVQAPCARRPWALMRAHKSQNRE